VPAAALPAGVAVAVDDAAEVDAVAPELDAAPNGLRSEVV
jgi:hypothetical protein